MVPKPFKKYYDGKRSHSTSQRPCITQIRPNNQNKQTKARESLKTKGSVILVPTTTKSILKYRILLLHYLSKLKYF